MPHDDFPALAEHVGNDRLREATQLKIRSRGSRIPRPGREQIGVPAESLEHRVDRKPSVRRPHRQPLATDGVLSAGASAAICVSMVLAASAIARSSSSAASLNFGVKT
jgi:hypothetical protein